MNQTSLQLEDFSENAEKSDKSVHTFLTSRLDYSHSFCMLVAAFWFLLTTGGDMLRLYFSHYPYHLFAAKVEIPANPKLNFIHF